MTKYINRRDFLKRLGLGGVAVSGLSLAGCVPEKGKVSPEGTENGPIPTDKMTYRTNPKTGEKVSILGYGCMRWPTKKITGENGETEEVLDQDTINSLVDEAIAHGVNYFDTSPSLLPREIGGGNRHCSQPKHPRDSYYIATKLSNFSPESQSREASIKMYRDSLRYLQTDYIDYMLLHAVGEEEWKTFINATSTMASLIS